MPLIWSGEGFEEVGKTENGKVVLKISKEYYRPTEVDYLLGDSSKAAKQLGWEPQVSFKELVSMMVKADYERLKKMKDAGLL